MTPYRNYRKFKVGDDGRVFLVDCDCALCKPAEPIAKQQEPTARAILDLDRKPLTERQQQIGENIARSVEAMTHNSLIGSYRRGEW